MSKPSRRKTDRKQKKNKRKAERDKEQLSRREAWSKFPNLVFEADAHAPSTLVDLVRSTISEIVVNHRQMLPSPVVKWFHKARRSGFATVMQEVREAAHLAIERGDRTAELDEIRFHLLLGEALFAAIPAERKPSFFPFNDVQVHLGRPNAKSILVSVRSLLQRKTSGGIAYFSPRRPTAEAGGETKIAAFFDHAMKRICERTVGNPTTYSGQGDAFAYLHSCVYFEPCSLPKSEFAFSVWEKCLPQFFAFEFARNVLEDLDASKNYYYRVGYCPAVVHDDLLVATTLLTPGMDGTPEFEKVLRPDIRSVEQKKEVRKSVEQLTIRGLVEHRDFSMIKSFHNAGIPQVVAMDREVFKYD